MTFWSNANADPTRKYRFKISHTKIDKDDWFWANTVTKPTVTVSSNDYQIINHIFKVPGVALWEDVTVQVVDVGKKAKKIYDSFISSGYRLPPATTIPEGIKKDSQNKLFIYQLNGAGKQVEKWTLHNTFIKSINFGDLDYSSDDLLTLEITFGYDFAELE